MILILGGTTEAFRVAEELLRQGKEFVLSTATQYGLESFRERFGHRVLNIIFTPESLKDFIAERGVSEVVDCTHPYAEEITRIAKDVTTALAINYRSAIREVEKCSELDYEKAVILENFGAAADFILKHGIKRPLFTTGSKDLSFVPLLKGIEIFIRVLPYEASIKRCHDAGVKRPNIIAMQGPFSAELNRTIIREYGIDCIVTKQSGREGGFREKVEGAKNEGIWLIIITGRSDV